MDYGPGLRDAKSLKEISAALRCAEPRTDLVLHALFSAFSQAYPKRKPAGGGHVHFRTVRRYFYQASFLFFKKN